MMQVKLELQWKLGSGELQPLDGTLFALLEGIAEHGSLQEAARRAGVSYRHAWGSLTGLAAELGNPLVELERGRGTRLAPLGESLLAARKQAQAELGPRLAQLAQEFSHGLSRRSIAARPLRICASHDLALLKTRDALAAHGLALDLQIHGSLESLELLARRRCDAAGFHVASGESPQDAVREAFGRNARDAIRLIETAKREQGLMLRTGLRTKVTGLADLARTGAQFINRQRGSGTRALLDRLLHSEGLRASDIRGYQDEEFTHLAVAATVAGGGADAAFGIRAAAAQFGLRFVPLASETYYLACREERRTAEAIGSLQSFLRGLDYRQLCASLGGYDTAQAGNSAVMTLIASGRSRLRRVAA